MCIFFSSIYLFFFVLDECEQLNRIMSIFSFILGAYNESWLDLKLINIKIIFLMEGKGSGAPVLIFNLFKEFL